MKIPLAQVHQIVDYHMCKIQELFVDEVKITLVARHPDGPATSILFTDEPDVEVVVETIRELRKRDGVR